MSFEFFATTFFPGMYIHMYDETSERFDYDIKSDDNLLFRIKQNERLVEICKLNDTHLY